MGDQGLKIQVVFNHFTFFFAPCSSHHSSLEKCAVNAFCWYPGDSSRVNVSVDFCLQRSLPMMESYSQCLTSNITLFLLLRSSSKEDPGECRAEAYVCRICPKLFAQRVRAHLCINGDAQGNVYTCLYVPIGAPLEKTGAGNLTGSFGTGKISKYLKTNFAFPQH